MLNTQRSVLLVVETAGDLVGFAYAEFRAGAADAHSWWARLCACLGRRGSTQPVLLASKGWLGHLFVAPAFRRRGIGLALLEATADWAREEGAQSLELNVLHANDAARRLYQCAGMTELLVQYRKTL
jgi:GNAT superfamily N-acetyltransferase